MTILMDDPTTYLQRDTEDIAIVVADSIATVMDAARSFGVSIQVNLPDNKGIRVVTNETEAVAVAALFGAATPWAILPTGESRQNARKVLLNKFGPPTTLALCLGVETVGTAWRADKFRFG